MKKETIWTSIAFISFVFLTGEAESLGMQIIWAGTFGALLALSIKRLENMKKPHHSTTIAKKIESHR